MFEDPLCFCATYYYYYTTTNNLWVSRFERHVQVYDVTTLPTAERGAVRFRKKCAVVSPSRIYRDYRYMAKEGS